MEIVLDEMLATLACQSLLYEAVTWPKPGLITAKSSGKHTDMNIYHFLDSSVGLYSYFKKLVLLVEGELTLSEIFEKSRELGKVAEERMYFETHGVNTHKGAIFILGLLVVTIAYCKKYNLPFKEIQPCIKEMTQDLVQRDFQKIHVPKTYGEKLYLEKSVSGIRGEAERGFPIIFELGVPFFDSLSYNIEKKILQTLIFMIQYLEDTTLLHGNKEKNLTDLQIMAKECIQIGGIETSLGIESYKKIEKFCLKEKISPGGAADCVAAIIFLSKVKERLWK